MNIYIQSLHQIMSPLPSIFTGSDPSIPHAASERHQGLLTFRCSPSRHWAPWGGTRPCGRGDPLAACCGPSTWDRKWQWNWSITAGTAMRMLVTRLACIRCFGQVECDDDAQKLPCLAPTLDVPTPWNQLNTWITLFTKVLHRLQGSVIPKLFGIGRSRHGTPFLATSLVRGTCLSALLPRGIPSAVRKAAVLALSRFHKEGALHGDITLNNMILESQDDAGYDHNDSAVAAAVVEVGAGGTGASVVGTESGGPKEQPATTRRVVILDFGRSSIGASCEEMNQEMTRLRRILRGA